MWELPLVLLLVPGIAPLLVPVLQFTGWTAQIQPRETSFSGIPCDFHHLAFLGYSKGSACSANGVVCFMQKQVWKESSKYKWASALCCGCPSLEVFRVRLDEVFEESALLESAPCLWTGSWNLMVFKVPSQTILWLLRYPNPFVCMGAGLGCGPLNWWMCLCSLQCKRRFWVAQFLLARKSGSVRFICQTRWVWICFVLRSLATLDFSKI